MLRSITVAFCLDNYFDRINMMFYYTRLVIGNILLHRSITFFSDTATWFLSVEKATGGVLEKKLFLKISQNSKENTCAKVSFLINFIRPTTLFKRDSDPTVFLWNMQNF